MSSKEKTAKLPKKAGGTPAQPTMLTKVVAALIKSDRPVKKNKGMAIVPSVSNWIVSKWTNKLAKHTLRAAIERGTQIGILQRPNASHAGLTGSIKIHPKFAKLLADRDTSGDNTKEVANAIAAFIKIPRSPSPEPKAAGPKKKAVATAKKAVATTKKVVATAKKPKANFPVAQKKTQATGGSGTAKKRPAKAQEDEPKAKKAKK